MRGISLLIQIMDPHWIPSATQLVWLAPEHLGLDNRDRWGWIITNSAYCDENDNDTNNNIIITKSLACPLSPISVSAVLKAR